MKLRTLDDVRATADVRVAPQQRTLSQQQRLERWAEALERCRVRYLHSLYRIEYARPEERKAMREDRSPLTVAFEDSVLRAEGLRSDRYGDALQFFALPDNKLHYIVCYCHHGPTMRPKAVARRVRAVAGRKERESFGWGLLPLGF